MRTEILAVFALLVIATPTLACSPAPSCWIESGPEYLRAVCAGYAKDGRTVQEIASYLDDPKEIMTFVEACAKLHVYFVAPPPPG